jgi:hypothetical protein
VTSKNLVTSSEILDQKSDERLVWLEKLEKENSGQNDNQKIREPLAHGFLFWSF